MARRTGKTTEPRRHIGRSVRFRITSSVCVLVAVALAGAGLLVLVLATASVSERIADESDQEMAEFTGLQRNGVDPRTGEKFRSIEQLLRLYLKRNVPSRSELLVGHWDGRIRVASASPRGALVEDSRFAEAVAERVETGGVTRVQSAWGEVQLDVLPLADETTRGAFVVAFFLQDETRGIQQTLKTYAVASMVALVVVTAVAAGQAGRLLAPVRTLRETAEEISETDLSRRIPETGNDDITDLTRTFNAMLGRLDDAFNGQREFLDDAGHELRTPLTILRGHLELLDVSDEEEVFRTRELLLDEVDRMSRLVDDLILLTKADRPGSFTFAPVDLGDLIEDVAAKARGLADRDWLVVERTATTLELDEHRITQAVIQLAQNAAKNTDVGDRISFGSRLTTSGQAVLLWVEDTGPGVPDDLKTRIFERFIQAPSASTESHQEGFGLGLSIVSAIITAHGGRVWVEDATPRGARFVIELPTTGRER